MNYIFKKIQKDSEKNKYTLFVQYFQIYKENIYDLLDTNSQRLKLRENEQKQVYIDGINEYSVSSLEEIIQLIKFGQEMRVTNSNRLNQSSS